jgi:signal transduction histidine kinase
MITTRSLVEEYTDQLATHLAEPSESVLLDAHELGRRAVTEGAGVIDLVNIHRHALRAVAANTAPATSEGRLDTAAEFLAEILSPFEMMLRGYRETNSQLTTRNQELQEAKVEAELANHELEAFSHSVAHDLRAPLRSLDGFSLMLLEDYAEKLDDEGRQHLQYIRESAQRMALLIDDLLTLSRVMRGEFQRRQVNLTDISRAVATDLQKTQPGRCVDFRIADGLTDVGDAGLLAIALTNLIGNAWKYTGKRARATIEVGTTVADGRRAYFVRDNGAGFDMAYASKLFGVFQRLHSEEEFEGTGIGLATVERVVRRHGGRIWAQARINEGATFFFTLSRAPHSGNEDRARGAIFPGADGEGNQEFKAIENGSLAPGEIRSSGVGARAEEKAGRAIDEVEPVC